MLASDAYGGVMESIEARFAANLTSGLTEDEAALQVSNLLGENTQKY
jgi:hypothetical protein